MAAANMCTSETTQLVMRERERGREGGREGGGERTIKHNSLQIHCTDISVTKYGTEHTHDAPVCTCTRTCTCVPVYLRHVHG